jgi:hypothetical protein
MLLGNIQNIHMLFLYLYYSISTIQIPFHITPTEQKRFCNFRSMACVSTIQYLGDKLPLAVMASAQAPSTSSSSPAVDQNHQIKPELKKLVTVTLYDVVQRDIGKRSVKLWYFSILA